MSPKTWLVKVAIVSVVMAFATVFYLQPTVHLNVLVSLGAIGLLDLVAYVVAGLVAGWGKRGQGLSILFGSVSLAALITLLFVPAHSPGFDWLVVGLLFIQLVGVASAWLIVRAYRR